MPLPGGLSLPTSPPDTATPAVARDGDTPTGPAAGRGEERETGAVSVESGGEHSVPHTEIEEKDKKQPCEAFALAGSLYR